jgi:hypothetical protein
VSVDDVDAVRQTLGKKWRSVNLFWFIVSLLVITAIGGIVYYATL